MKRFRASGWLPDPQDDRDYLLSAMPMASPVALPDEVDNSMYFKEISGQRPSGGLDLPNCTACAAADCWEALEVVQRLKLGYHLAQARNDTANLSRFFLWFYGKQLMNPPAGYDPTSGCYNRLIQTVLLNLGCCTEKSWPYVVANAAAQPALKCRREAMFHRTAGYHAIKETGNHRNELIRAALAEKHNVIFGTALDEEFDNYVPGTILDIPKHNAGLHAMVLCGWSKARNAYKIRNSWGTGWGEQGYGWASKAYIDDFEWTHSLWVPTYLPMHP